MKQHITKKQWDELSPEEMAKFFIMFYREYIGKEWFKYWRCETVKKKIFDFRPSIGQMIEFLGDDDYPKALCEEWGDGLDVPKDYIGVPTNKLCDALWEAVKNKINKC